LANYTLYAKTISPSITLQSKCARRILLKAECDVKFPILSTSDQLVVICTALHIRKVLLNGIAPSPPCSAHMSLESLGIPSRQDVCSATMSLDAGHDRLAADLRHAKCTAYLHRIPHCHDDESARGITVYSI
jgi:hypothetical protein